MSDIQKVKPVPGWYWFRWCPETYWRPYYVASNGSAMGHDLQGYPPASELSGEWCGPITPPTEEP